jgi:hypothetical protein
MALNAMQYMLFPFTILSETEYRHLSILLPRLSVLQVIRPPVIPAWLQKMVTGWPVITEQERIENIKLCLKGYQEFATVHRENSVLSSVSLDQISRDFAESRFRIQTQLKKDDPNESDASESSLPEAAIFLEMARDLDEKEMEVEAGFTQIGDLEGEFRQILGISDDEESADTIETLVPPLRAEKAYLSFMIPKRIHSWFRLISNRMPEACPALVTTSEQVVEELFEPLREEYDRAGKSLQLSRIPLGSIPAMDDLPMEEFFSMLSEPEASGLLTSYWHSLDNLLASPHDSTNQAELSRAADTLQDYLIDYRRGNGLFGSTEMRIELVFDSEMRWSDFRKHCDQESGSGLLIDHPCPDDLVKILVCQF